MNSPSLNYIVAYNHVHRYIISQFWPDLSWQVLIRSRLLANCDWFSRLLGRHSHVKGVKSIQSKDRILCVFAVDQLQCTMFGHGPGFMPPLNSSQPFPHRLTPRVGGVHRIKTDLCLKLS